MLGLDDVKLLHALSCVALCLIIALPTLAMVVSFPQGEPFSEIWLLGAEHVAEAYPFNVAADAVYRVYLGVGNHMGRLEAYRVLVKLRNQTEPLPDASSGTPSGLGSLFEYRMFAADRQAWEHMVAFAFTGVSFEDDVCRVSGLVVDGHAVSAETSAVWDEENRGFYVQLFFELWRYNNMLSAFQYHGRFVGLWLNMTRMI